MASIRVVPWSNATQFQKVYEYLYSNEITKMKWALDTISVWESRCHPSLPTAIEATYVLISAVVQDILWNHGTSLVQHVDLQGIYGSAVSRFVSLCVEVNKKDVLKCSMAEVAKSIGIESFIVDIRNEWCHSSRPSLSLLRKAAQSALEFLKASYWEKEAACLNNYIKQPMDDKTELIGLFKEFLQFDGDGEEVFKTKVFSLASKNHRGQNLSKPNLKKVDSSKRRSQYRGPYEMLMIKLEECLRMNKRLFVKVLISDGIFIPFDDELECLLSPEEFTFFNTPEEDEDTGEDIDFEELKYFPGVPESHEKVWVDIILLLNKYDAVPLFMEELLKTQGDRTMIGQKLLISWILAILRLHSIEIGAVKTNWLKKIFRHKGIIPNWLRMFHAAMINPCKYFFALLPLLTCNLDLDINSINSIIALAAVKLGLRKESVKTIENCKLFHTVEDLKLAIARQEQKREEQRRSKEQSTENIWSSCSDECHKLWPIGHIVNAVVDKKDQEEDEEDEIFECMELSAVSDDYDERRLNCNKNDDDDDQTCKMKELSLKMINQIEKRQNCLLY